MGIRARWPRLWSLNSRLDELQAAILRAKLKRLNEWNEARNLNANLYFELLHDVGDLQMPLEKVKYQNLFFISL
jgi:dTDP-4-amino-4,6-dideoxygalactose transaminase